jgi:hypothetical protein
MRRFEQVIARGRPAARPAAVSALIASIDALSHECVRRGETEKLPEHAGAAKHVAEKLLN